MVGRRQSQGERIFSQILTKVLKLKKGKSYRVAKQYNQILSRPVLGSGDFYSNCLWNVGGSKAFELDFCFPNDRIAVEIDGGYHDSPEQQSRDEQKDNRLRLAGWAIIRIQEVCVTNVLAWMLIDKKKIFS